MRRSRLPDGREMRHSRITVRYASGAFEHRYGSTLPKAGDRLGRNGEEGFVTSVEVDGPEGHGHRKRGYCGSRRRLMGGSQCSREARRRNGEGARPHPGRGVGALLETRNSRHRHRGGACQSRCGEVDALPPLPVERGACHGVPSVSRTALDARGRLGRGNEAGIDPSRASTRNLRRVRPVVSPRRLRRMFIHQGAPGSGR